MLITATGYGQISMDSLYKMVKEYNVHTNSVNWTNIDHEFQQRLQTARNDLDSLYAIVFVFEQLKDYHSAIIYKGNYLTNYPSFDDSTLKYLAPLVNLSNQQTGHFKAKLMDEKYVYLQIPTVQAMGDDVSVYAQMLSDTLSKYATRGTKGVILDLRLNGGGQFSSMVGGLAPLLGNKYIGGGVDKDSVQTMKFSIKKGNIYLNDNQRTFIQHKSKLNLSKLPVAIIIGPATRSSGSILAISFKGRTRTMFIGENTANGYTTSNDYFVLSNNLYLNLSTTNSIDRRNRVYKEVVEPDIVMKGEDNFDVLESDIKVKSALKWLKEASH
jgi:carboxyl-terminal processing protease